MNLELHADDLGATESVNRGILSAWLEGALSGVSVLANGDALQSAAAELNRHPERELRVVAHLNLSEANALAAPGSVNLLTDTEGRFKHGFLALWMLWLRANRHLRQTIEDQITLEWRTQIAAIRQAIAPRTVDALDGHIHVQMLPFAFPIAVKLAQEFGIREIRISNEQTHISLKDSMRIGYIVNIVKHVLLRLLARRARRHAISADLDAPDAVAGLFYSGRMSKHAIAAAERVALKKGCRWLEVICHPGRADPGESARWDRQPGLAEFYLSPDRDFEYESLIEFSASKPGDGNKSS